MRLLINVAILKRTRSPQDGAQRLIQVVSAPKQTLSGLMVKVVDLRAWPPTKLEVPAMEPEGEHKPRGCPK
ncbi:unnamed protein product, partial [Clonostachys chloroleuca]